MESGLLTKKENGWFIIKSDKSYRLVDEDIIFCMDSDHGTKVEFTVVPGEDQVDRAKLVGSEYSSMSWEEIEEWYASDNFPPFGGPFSDALSHFEWLKIYFEPPRMKMKK